MEFIGECNRAGGPNDKSATRAMTVMWMIQSAANVLEVPCLKSLGGKFGEIKVGNVRILYFVFKGDYFFSHGIIKKGQKLPPKHMDRLLAAYKSVL